MAGMSVTKPSVIQEWELDDLEELEGEQPHIECCRVERFYCGAKFHPELSAQGNNAALEEVCEECTQILERNRCWRGHNHCPIPLMIGLVCPEP